MKSLLIIDDWNGTCETFFRIAERIVLGNNNLKIVLVLNPDNNDELPYPFSHYCTVITDVFHTKEDVNEYRDVCFDNNVPIGVRNNSFKNLIFKLRN